MYRNNAVVVKSLEFAVRAVNLYKHLVNEKREQVMSKQLLRSATSIGANAKEASYAQSRNDFISKLSIALKEAAETEYWLELLSRTGYLTQREYVSMQKDCGELAKILIATLKSTKRHKDL